MPAATEKADVIVIGAGAAGLFFAAEAARRGKRVVALDHAEKLGEKIRISGGGRCNFTNLHTAPANFLSENPKFCISALRRFIPKDFIARVDRAGIAWHEKKLGQLFCDGSAQQVVDMLLEDCRQTGVQIRSGTSVQRINRKDARFEVETSNGGLSAPALVIATGGKSIPKIGASGFGYQIAEQFGLSVIELRPALVPITFDGDVKAMAKDLAGVSCEASLSVATEGAKQRRAAFREGMLFTHRGLSGPSVLQISSYWREGTPLRVDFTPDTDLFAKLKSKKDQSGKASLQTALAEHLPKRFAQRLCTDRGWDGPLAEWPDKKLRAVAETLAAWEVTPVGTEGYRTAEVTAGGVDTNALNSKTMEANNVPGLYFIGEVVDVTGWLGGYNFQWAWASAYAAAQAV